MTFLAAEALPPILPDRRIAAGTIVSIGLHGLALAGLLLLTPLKSLVVPPPEPVAVEIVTPQQFAALTAPPAPQQITTTAPVETPEAALPVAAPPEAADRLPPSPPLVPDLPQPVTHKATKFYSASILREPGMERIRKAFDTLASSERLVQLCNIEGLEQIKRAETKFAPDTLVGYAMADPVSTGLTLSAAGGAFRSRRKWYGVSFQCTVAPDYSGVTAFQFTVGDPIPEDEWEDHNLNSEDEDE